MKPWRRLISVEFKKDMLDTYLEVEVQIVKAIADGYIKDGNSYISGNVVYQAMALPEILGEELAEC